MKTTVAARAAARTVAVVGTGSMGLQHVAALQRLPGIRPVAIPQRPARRAALEAEGIATASTVAEAVRAGATHCVIATDTARHLADALAALAGGLDVLVEKPMAATSAEARRLRAASGPAGRRLVVGCLLRCSESLAWFRAQLPALGVVHAVRIECQSYLPDWRPDRPYQASYSARAQEGGVLRDLIHEIDYAGWLFGWPTALAARVESLGRLGIAAEEAADLLWTTPTGTVVSMRLDYLTRPARRWIQAAGAHGTVAWDGIAQTVTWAPAAGPAQVRRSAQRREAMVEAQLRAFLDGAGACGDGPALATADDGVKALAICEAARAASAAKAEQPVAV